MGSRNPFAPGVTAGLLAVGMLAVAPAANAASVGPALLEPAKDIRNIVVEIKKRGGGAKIYVPIAPSYLYYDYPYYYSRGFYPTHIKPGFIYYGYPYSYYTSRYRKHVRARKNWRQ